MDVKIMDLPQAFYPASTCPHDKKREIFADYGKHLHVDVADADGKVFQTQSLHPGSKINLRLSATAPTLPLTETPNLFVYPFEDRVSGKLIQKRLKAQNFVFRFPKMNGYISQDERKREKQIKTSWFSSLLKAYKLVHDNPFVPSVNAAYTGGCLTCIDSQDNKEIHLIHAAGNDFNILRHVMVRRDGCTNLLQRYAVVDKTVNSPMFEITSSRVGQEEFCAVRQEFGYQLFGLESADNVKKFVSLDSRTFMQERLTSLAISPYIKGEILVATEKGSLFLVRSGESMTKFQKNWQPRFECFESWRQCYFAGHPRQFVTADRTTVKLFDSRTHYRELVDLFALPNKSLQHSERVMVAKQQTSCAFHHIVATDASMFVIDQRFPGHQLSHWTFSQNSPPQYISSCDISLSDDVHTNIIAVSTQHPAETYCFPIQFGGLSPLQTIAQPWRISRISDFSKFDSVTSSADMMLSQQRFDTSLAGVAICPAEKQHSFHAFQLDSQGEIFFQTYEMNSAAVDKTLSAGPGGRHEYLCGSASNRADGWLRSLQKQFVDFCYSKPDLYDVVKFNSEHMITDMITEHLTHLLCPLCTFKSDHDSPSIPDRDLDQEIGVCENCGETWDKRDNLNWDGLASMEDMDMCQNCGHSLTSVESSHKKQRNEDKTFMEGIDVCENCGHSLKISEALYAIRTTNSVLGEDEVNLELFNRQMPALDAMSQSSANTQILTKLWRGESDIMQLLAEREEVRKKKKQEKRQLLKEYKKRCIAEGKVRDLNELEEEIPSDDSSLEIDLSDEETHDFPDISDEHDSVQVDGNDEKQRKDNSNVEQTQVENLLSALSESEESILGFYVSRASSKLKIKQPVSLTKPKDRIGATKQKDTNFSKLMESNAEIMVTPEQHRFKSISDGKVEADVKRRRHSSVSSEKSTHSTSSHVGFMDTPPRLKKKDIVWDIGPSHDEESLDLFSQFANRNFILNPEVNVSPGGFKSPTHSTKSLKKKFPKSSKKHISGF